MLTSRLGCRPCRRPDCKGYITVMPLRRSSCPCRRHAVPARGCALGSATPAGGLPVAARSFCWRSAALGLPALGSERAGCHSII